MMAEALKGHLDLTIKLELKLDLELEVELVLEPKNVSRCPFKLP